MFRIYLEEPKNSLLARELQRRLGDRKKVSVLRRDLTRYYQMMHLVRRRLREKMDPAEMELAVDILRQIPDVEYLSDVVPEYIAQTMESSGDVDREFLETIKRLDIVEIYALLDLAGVEDVGI